MRIGRMVMTIVTWFDSISWRIPAGHASRSIPWSKRPPWRWLRRSFASWPDRRNIPWLLPKLNPMRKTAFKGLKEGEKLLAVELTADLWLWVLPLCPMQSVAPWPIWRVATHSSIDGLWSWSQLQNSKPWKRQPIWETVGNWHLEEALRVWNS